MRLCKQWSEVICLEAFESRCDIMLPELGAVMIGAENEGAAATWGVGVCVATTPCIAGAVGLNSALPGHCVTIDAINACCWTSCVNTHWCHITKTILTSTLALSLLYHWSRMIYGCRR